MTEKTTTATAVPQQVREQYKAAEDVYQGTVRTWNDLLLTTTELTLDAMEKGFHYGFEISEQTQRVAGNALTTYRQIYLDSLKSWQNYVNNINKIVIRD